MVVRLIDRMAVAVPYRERDGNIRIIPLIRNFECKSLLLLNGSHSFLTCLANTIKSGKK